MTELQRALSRFKRHLMLRLAGYAGLTGLLLALVVVIAAPWLRESFGMPGYWVTLALPVVVPLIYVAWALARQPDRRTVVMAADAWCGAEGSIISAWELEREHPDSPFVKPVAAKAVARLKNHRLPEPRLLRKLLAALVVLLLLVPTSRFIHAQIQEAEREEQREEQARLTDVKPEEAEKLAVDAGTAAEKAKEAGAREQEGLADDIEQLARDAQAGGTDKERALREANSLVDRARAQTEAQKRRAAARNELREQEATGALGEAIERTDADAVEREIKKLTDRIHRPDGSIDKEAAEQARRAIRQAQREAPQDARLRRAAESVEKLLKEETLKNTEARRERAREEMEREGLSESEINAALDALDKTDKQALAKALEELAKASSPLRDLDPSGGSMEDLLDRLKDTEITPEQARRLAEMGRELSERLELDAETLREMLKEGRDFEGLEEAARKAMEQAESEGRPIGPEEAPEWAKDAVPESLREAWAEEMRARGMPGAGEDPAGNRGGGTDPSEGGGHAGGEGTTREVDAEGREEGVDMSDTGQGDKDPDTEARELNPDKAGDENVRRGLTGRDGSSSGINTRDEEERLPRRFRDAARKYFERD